MISPLFFLLFIVCLLLIQRGIELRIAARNERNARNQGGKEFGASHYPLFFLLHGSWFVGWLLESIWRGPVLSPHWPILLSLLVIAQLLRYIAITTLGPHWNTRIIVLPGNAPIRHGIYKHIPHPNYLAVVIELASIPLLFHAWWTCLIASLLNACLLLFIRIPLENKALKESSFPPQKNESNSHS